MGEIADRLPEGGHVLDLGCGNGEKLALLAGRGLELVGVDADTNRRLVREVGFELLID